MITRPTTLTILLALALAAPPSSAGGADWNRFRGPNGGGVVDGRPLPVRFGPDARVLWKTPAPPGHSSPILAGELIVITGEEGDELLTLAYDRATGRERWRRAAPRPRRETLDNRNGPAAPSAATDDRRIVVFFGDYGVLAYDHAGAELWRRPLGPFHNLYGMGASPILAEGRVILPLDQQVGSTLVALDAATGDQLWQVDRPEAKSGHSTAVLHRPPGGATQVVLPGSFYLTAYALEDGERRWWVRGLSFEMKSTPALSDTMLYINGYGSPMNEQGQSVRLAPFAQTLAEHDADGNGRLDQDEAPDGLARDWFTFNDLDGNGALDATEWAYFQEALDSRNSMLAVRLPEAAARGDLTASHVAWQTFDKVPQLPSPVVYRDVVWMINDRGIATSLRADSGETIAQQRIEGALDSYYSSPVAGDGKVYFVGRSGKVAVLPANGTLQPIAVNDLDETLVATPAIADGVIYLRTQSALYAFAGGDPANERTDPGGSGRSR
ncbi:MAG TPA: PQQ-binding-like beta-propeller repeat protein [Thermoanaerobaculia bacterium]|nr:PQQ-binding-like beta-propeller repeat protein [Thermoanaerobaculia bacterium]